MSAFRFRNKRTHTYIIYIWYRYTNFGYIPMATNWPCPHVRSPCSPGAVPRCHKDKGVAPMLHPTVVDHHAQQGEDLWRWNALIFVDVFGRMVVLKPWKCRKTDGFINWKKVGFLMISFTFFSLEFWDVEWKPRPSLTLCSVYGTFSCQMTMSFSAQCICWFMCLIWRQRVILTNCKRDKTDPLHARYDRKLWLQTKLFFDDAMTDKEPMNAGVMTFTFLHTRMCIYSYPHIDIQLVHTYLYQINQQSV